MAFHTSAIISKLLNQSNAYIIDPSIARRQGNTYCIEPPIVTFFEKTKKKFQETAGSFLQKSVEKLFQTELKPIEGTDDGDDNTLYIAAKSLTAFETSQTFDELKKKYFSRAERMYLFIFARKQHALLKNEFDFYKEQVAFLCNKAEVYKEIIKAQSSVEIKINATATQNFNIRPAELVVIPNKEKYEADLNKVNPAEKPKEVPEKTTPRLSNWLLSFFRTKVQHEIKEENKLKPKTMLEEINDSKKLLEQKTNKWSNNFSHFFGVKVEHEGNEYIAAVKSLPPQLWMSPK